MSGTDPSRQPSRRRFLAGAGALAGAVVGGHAVSVWGPALAAGAGRTPRQRTAARRTVVFLELAGGNDGLGTVVPFADPDYRRLRPTLAIDDPIDLDGAVGLHPSLSKLAERYRAGQVAIVERVGYPDHDLSHLASLASWWSGQPGTASTTGWLGRYLDATVGFDNPLAGVVIGPGLSPALLGEHSFATSIADASGLEPRVPPWVPGPGDLVEAWTGLAPHEADRHTLVGQVQDAIGLTGRARAELDRALAASPASVPPDSEGAARATDGTAVDALDLAARLVTAQERPRVVYLTDLGDYDTHQGQVARQADLLLDLDGGLDRFLSAIEAAGVADEVVVVTVSEFGRRAQENGSGTDHGAANAHLVIGSRVEGGRYGEPTSLGALDSRGNLTFAVDYRTVYATVLAGWLDTDPEPILGKGFTPQAIFA